jgi:hypothetical protein
MIAGPFSEFHIWRAMLAAATFGRMTGNPEIMRALGRCCDRFRFADNP